MSCAVSSTWPDGAVVAGERRAPRVDQRHLADAGRGLLGRQIRWAAGQSERLEARGDRTGGHDHDVGARPSSAPRSRRRASSSRAPSNMPGRRGQRGGADLDHDAARGADRPRGAATGHGSLAHRMPRRSRRAALRSAAPTPGRSAPAACRCRGPTASRRRRRASAAPSRRSSSPMVTAQPGSAPSSQQLVLDAEPGQPVAEVADRLVVVEIGLADPAFGPHAAHDEARRRRRARRVKPLSSTGDRPDHRPARRTPAAARRGRPTTISHSANVNGRKPSWVTADTSNTGQPRAAISSRTNSASSRASGRRSC